MSSAYVVTVGFITQLFMVIVCFTVPITGWELVGTLAISHICIMVMAWFIAAIWGLFNYDVDAMSDWPATVYLFWSPLIGMVTPICMVIMMVVYVPLYERLKLSGIDNRKRKK